MLLAIKTFFRAFKDPEGAQRFLNHKKTEQSAATPLMVLSFLQKHGRLVDFLQEDISKFSDHQIGAASRKIQQDCAQALKKLFVIKPLLDELEGKEIVVPAQHDESRIKVVGHVKGPGPYKGIVRHRGWKIEEQRLTQVSLQDQVICPAEIEVTR